MARPKGQALTNILPWHRRVFNALSGPKAGNYGLFSCFVNGEPTSAIVQISRHDSDFVVRPIFIAPTEGMIITDHAGTPITPQPGD